MENGWVSVQDKVKAYVNDSQITHDCLAITGSKLNRYNVIHNTTIRIAAFCHITVCSLVQIYKSYVPSVHFYHSTWLVIPHNGDLNMYRPQNPKPCKSAKVFSLFGKTKH
jgi:hypothetical protein